MGIFIKDKGSAIVNKGVTNTIIYNWDGSEPFKIASDVHGRYEINHDHDENIKNRLWGYFSSNGMVLYLKVSMIYGLPRRGGPPFEKRTVRWRIRNTDGIEYEIVIDYKIMK